MVMFQPSNGGVTENIISNFSEYRASINVCGSGGGRQLEDQSAGTQCLLQIFDFVTRWWFLAAPEHCRAIDL